MESIKNSGLRSKMRKCLFLILSMLFSSLVYSKEGLVHAGGVGYDVHDGGISIKRIRGEGNSIQFIAGTRYETRYEGELDFNLAVKFRDEFLSSRRTKIDRFFGFALVRDDTYTRDIGRTSFFVNVGVIPEVFIFDNFSAEIALGLSLGIIGESRLDAGDNYIMIDTFGSGIGLGNISFHYYFGR